MSILIPNMEMPKNCADCPLFEDKYHYHGCHAMQKSFTDMDMWNFVGDRPSWCPLIELPPHGDLIDRDALVVKSYETEGGYAIVEWDDVEAMPTIIEADNCNNSSETCNKTCDKLINASKEFEAYAKNQEDCIKDLVAKLEAKEKTGKWLRTPTHWVYCSECGSEPPNETNATTPYCPWCGARMVEDG